MDTIKVENGKLTVLKGKMAAGKSMAMLIDAKDYIDFKMGVLFFSLEQSSSKIYDKFFDKVKAKKENSAFMHVIDMASSLDTIEKVIEDAKGKVSIIYIDSIEAIRGSKNDDVLRKLHKIAKETKAPIVITSQVSAKNEDTTDLDKLVDEIKELIPSDIYNDCNKQIVLRNFSKYESYDYFSSTVRTVNPDGSVDNYSTFNLSDYFNN
jgi:replicative DNA helicase